MTLNGVLVSVMVARLVIFVRLLALSVILKNLENTRSMTSSHEDDLYRPVRGLSGWELRTVPYAGPAPAGRIA